MARQNFNYNGLPYCGELIGSLPGNLTINGATVGICQVDPPPGNDPTDIELVNIVWRTTRTHGITDARDFRNLAGRLAFSDVPRDFDYRSSSSFLVPFATGRHLRSRIVVPANAPNIRHLLKSSMYEATQGRQFTAAIVAPGAWLDGAVPNGIVYNRSFSDAVLFDITTNANDPSTTRVKLPPGSVVDFLVVPEEPAPLVGGFVWN